MGVAIGNGVMDMLIQEPSYTEYAYSHGLIPLGAKIAIDKKRDRCIKQLLKNTKGKKLTRGAMLKCGTMSQVLKAAGSPNEFNTATFVQYSFIDKGTALDSFMQDHEVQTAIHVRGVNLPGINFAVDPSQLQVVDIPSDSNSSRVAGQYYAPSSDWAICNNDINEAFVSDHPISVVPVIQSLIERNIKVSPSVSAC